MTKLTPELRKQLMSELGRLGGSKKSEAKTKANQLKIKKRWDDYRANQK